MGHVADEVPWMMMYGWVCLTNIMERSTGHSIGTHE